jgi:hypothetical protein
MTSAHETPYHVPAHTTETDHANLHVTLQIRRYVVDRYNTCMSLGLSAKEKNDEISYLELLGVLCLGKRGEPADKLFATLALSHK